MRVVVTCFLVWSLTVSPASAWNATGHKIIASIAFRQLTATEQAKIVAMLKRHPRFIVDFADQMPADVRGADEATQNEWLFQQAAVWPDTVRSGPADKRAFNRSEWHYVNVPVFLTEAARTELNGRLTVNLAMDPPPDATLDTQRMNVVQAIRFARAVIGDERVTLDSRAVMLAWLFHDVGDIHQPLHSSALFSTRLFREGDRGGNLIRTSQSGNLHALWDQFPGRSETYRVARNKAIADLANPELVALGTKAESVLDEKVWLDESHELAKAAAYAPEVLDALRIMEASGGDVEEIGLSEAYLKAGGRETARRLVQAGYRLGAVLKQLAK